MVERTRILGCRKRCPIAATRCWPAPPLGSQSCSTSFDISNCDKDRDRSITQDEYDKKARELKESRAEIAAWIEQHKDCEGTFRTTLETLISAASRAADIFERSNIDEKRQLVAFVFSNLRLRGKKLEFALRSPFDLTVDRPDYASWLGRQDSNLRSRDQNPVPYRLATPQSYIDCVKVVRT